jgi:hypothetical protein
VKPQTSRLPAPSQASDARYPSSVLCSIYPPSELTPEEKRNLLDSIEMDLLIGLHDRGLIGLLVYKFACAGAATRMRVEDHYTQGRRG